MVTQYGHHRAVPPALVCWATAGYRLASLRCRAGGVERNWRGGRVRKLRAVVVLSILLGAVAAQASITESFTASGGWLIDWGLSVVLDSG